LGAKLDKVLNSGAVIAFLEGTPSFTKTDSSKKLAQILSDNGIRYNCFDVSVISEEMKNKIKEKLGDHQFPFLVVDKIVLGDANAIEKFASTNQLVSKIPAGEVIQNLKDKIQKLFNQAPVMLFMKGNPEAPQCGFSKRIVEILNRYHVDFNSFNILSDQEIRDGIKDVSGWKTYPQLYVEGKLVGGIDIVEELDESNEFEELVEKYIKA